MRSAEKPCGSSRFASARNFSGNLRGHSAAIGFAELRDDALLGLRLERQPQRRGELRV
jgi:hypothetical protein